ncbi:MULTISPECIES: SgcJ/EcaC family oxidoreductase [unclassified Kitasatospora]|uniref:SgcJ/EcaC family oxidoreductase n=1 Tax=unclassified Kitasatospora TaxID=2633591 RepID=UPI001ADFB514|nr:SgcJ/EcaC family oxidoreductase [Kitasatospora sp. RG8]MBP0455483.1 SgcJ/EcaC family oxidoreductase [Kitasatospora sp. RG8]
MNDTRLPELSPGDEGAVRALYHRALDGWNLRDGAAFAGPFAEGGEVIGFDGTRQCGRSVIAAELGRIFADHVTPEYVAKVRRVRALGPGVVQLDAVAGLVPDDAEDLDPALNALQTVIAVNSGAGWRIALLQNTPARYDLRPDLAQELTAELRALIGRGPGPA